MMRTLYLSIALSVAACATADAGDPLTYAASGTTASDLVLMDRDDDLIVTWAYASSDTNSQLTVQVGTTAIDYTGVLTNGQTVIPLDNDPRILTNGDAVVYWHINGVGDYTTISASTPSNATLATGISSAGTANDTLHEMSVHYRLPGTTSNSTWTGSPLIAWPAMRPVRLSVGATAACSVVATTME